MDNSDYYNSSSDSSDGQSSSESYLYDTDDSYEYPDEGEVRYSKRIFRTVLYSDRPEDKEKVKSVIVKCIKGNHLEVLYSLLRRSKLPLDEVLIKEKGQTALHLAYYNDAQNLVELILKDMRVNHINSTDCYGLTHLHVGCWAENQDLIKKCIEDGADVNASFVKNDSKGNTVSGITPLHLVCKLGISAPSKIVELLLQNGVDVNAIDSLGRSSLHLACCTFAFPYNRNDHNQMYRNVEIMRILLDHGCDVNKSDKNGNTPLLCIYRESYTVKILNKLWPHCFPFAESLEKLKLLLERGADVTVCNNDGDTALHRLIRMSLSSNYLPEDHCNYIFDPIRHVKMVEILLKTEQPININAKNSLGETPLQLAVSLMSADIVKVLLDHGADLGDLNFNQNDEYSFCYSYELPKLKQVYNLVNIVEMLLDKEFQLTLKDNLMILKFLIHDIKNCECGNVSFYDSFENYYNYDCIHDKLIKLLAFGSSKHFKYVFNEIITSLSAKNLIHVKKRALHYVQDLFHDNYATSFYLEKEIADFVKKIQIDYEVCNNWHAKLEQEIACMKTIKLVEEITVYDIMIKNPHDIYKYTKNINLPNLKLSNKFPIYKYMIEGHIAKSLIRHYVEKSAYDYLSELSFALLPDLCTQRILHYLSNEDVLKLCLSAVCEDVN